MRRLRLLALPALAIVLGAAAARAPAVPSIEVAERTTVIDVRTPAEYADGHLDGAVNIDVSAAGFATELAQLDPSADYVVYCQSGNRSSRAVAQMTQAGFTSVQDAGGLSSAPSATGLAVVD